MNIVLSTDNNFVQHCCVAIASILKNNTDARIFVLTEELTKYNMSQIMSIPKKLGGVIEIVNVPSNVVSRFPMPEGSFISHITVATYYRLLVATLLPLDVDRIIYLDCDIVVRGNISDLFYSCIDDYAIGAVYQDDSLWVSDEVYDRLGYPSVYGYFNAGVLLINLKYWRDNNVENRLINYINSHYRKIKFHDQDTLNGVLYKETLPISCKWNTMSYLIKGGINKVISPHCIEHQKEILKRDFNPIIVHFVSRLKPWEFGCMNPYKKDYYYYLSYTPYSNFLPKVAISKLAIKEFIRNSFLYSFLPFTDKSDVYIQS